MYAMAKTPSLGKRSNGFALALSHQHYYVIHQLYPWAREQGLTTPETDEALTLIPMWSIKPAEVKAAGDTGYISNMGFSDGFYRSKTIRVRAEHLQGMIRLLRLTAAFCQQGQVGGTLRRRANSLAEVSILDQLCDA